MATSSVMEALKVEKLHGTGSVKDLTKSQLKSLQSVCDSFRRSLEKNCNNYALYRCNLTSDGEVLYAVVYGSDEKGNLCQLQLGYDLNTSEVYTRKIELDNKKEVGKELYGLIIKLLETIPFSVGMLDIPVEGAFKEGIVTGYNKEEGTALIIVRDSLENSYFLD